MNFQCQSVFVRALTLLAALLVANNAAAQSKAAPAFAYPTKPIHIIVPYSPGGTSDILARVLGQKLTEAWGQQVIVDNKPGANGNIGADMVAKSPADGYTLLLADIVTKLNSELVRILKIGEVRERLAAQGAEARTDSAEALGTFIRNEKTRWAKVVKDAGIKIE